MIKEICSCIFKKIGFINSFLLFVFVFQVSFIIMCYYFQNSIYIIIPYIWIMFGMFVLLRFSGFDKMIYEEVLKKNENCFASWSA